MTGWTVTQVANGMLQQVVVEADSVTELNSGFIVFHTGPDITDGNRVDSGLIVALFPTESIISVVRDDEDDE